MIKDKYLIKAIFLVYCITHTSYSMIYILFYFLNFYSNNNLELKWIDEREINKSAIPTGMKRAFSLLKK